MEMNFKVPARIVQLVLMVSLSGGWPCHGHPTPLIKSEIPRRPPHPHPLHFKLQICGPRIKEAIAMICRHKAAYAPLERVERVERDLVPRRPYRAVVDDCCGLGCKVSELEKYCGKPLVDDPRLVSLEDFLRGLVEFFQQTSPRGGRDEAWSEETQFVSPWTNRSEVKEERLDESDETDEGDEGVSHGHVHGRRLLSSDELERDKEDETRSRSLSSYMVQLDYNHHGHGHGHWRGGRPSPRLGGGRMEEHASRRGHHLQVPVILPQSGP